MFLFQVTSFLYAWGINYSFKVFHQMLGLIAKGLRFKIYIYISVSYFFLQE